MLDKTIQRADLDDGLPSGPSGVAVIKKLIQGSGILLSSTGFDSGTGDVTVGLDSTIVVTTIYIGTNARLVALANGLRLEVKDAGAVWQTQMEWTE